MALLDGGETTSGVLLVSPLSFPNGPILIRRFARSSARYARRPESSSSTLPEAPQNQWEAATSSA